MSLLAHHHARRRLAQSLVEYTSFALLLKSYEGDPSATLWPDLSGHGRTAMVEGDFVLTPGSGTTPTAYVATADSLPSSTVRLPSITATPSEFTVYSAVRVDELSEVYLVLAGDNSGASASSDYTYLLLREAIAYFQRRTGVGSGPPVAVGAGQLAVITWRLRAGGLASVRLNGTVLATGLPYTPAAWIDGYFGNQQNNYWLRGALFGLAVSLGNDSDLRVELVEQMFMREIGLV